VSGPRIYRCASGIIGVKDTGQTLLVHDETGQVWTLEETEAVVWDWLAVGHGFAKIGSMLALLLGQPERETRSELARTLARWCEAGLVEEAGGG